MSNPEKKQLRQAHVTILCQDHPHHEATILSDDDTAWWLADHIATCAAIAGVAAEVDYFPHSDGELCPGFPHPTTSGE